MSKTTKKVSESRTTMSEMIMPNDTNPINNLMGGNLLRWMDIAAGIAAGRHCESYVVTVSVDHVSFSQPIPVGDVITIECVVTRAFNTSVEVFVEVFSANIKGQNMRKCNDAYFTFVAVDDAKKRPVVVPELLPLNKEEQQRYEDALKRRQIRLWQLGKLPAEEVRQLRETLFALP
jgi:acyl-CoA hydrolase